MIRYRGRTNYAVGVRVYLVLERVPIDERPFFNPREAIYPRRKLAEFKLLPIVHMPPTQSQPLTYTERVRRMTAIVVRQIVPLQFL